MVSLQPFQKHFIRGAMASGINPAALTMPRGNGKSWLAAVRGEYRAGPDRVQVHSADIGRRGLALLGLGDAMRYHPRGRGAAQGDWFQRQNRHGTGGHAASEHGRRHTVWVLMDDVSENPSGVTSEDSGKHSGGDTGAENLALQAEVRGLRELVGLYRERLTDADWLYQELMGQFKPIFPS